MTPMELIMIQLSVIGGLVAAQTLLFIVVVGCISWVLIGEAKKPKQQANPMAFMLDPAAMAQLQDQQDKEKAAATGTTEGAQAGPGQYM